MNSVFKKSFYIIITISILVLAFQNCSPSFQSINLESSDEIDGTDIDYPPVPPTSFSGSVVLDERRFKSLINPIDKKINLRCEDQATESVKVYPSLLSKEEVANGISDLLGITPNLAGYPILTKANGYQESNKFTLTDSYLNTIHSLASSIANQFYTSLENNTNTIWKCTNSCIDLIKNDIAKLLWRRPLDNTEISKINLISGLYTADKSKSIEVLSFILSAPQFYTKNLSEKSAQNGQLVSLWQQAENMAFIIGSTFTPKELFNKIEKNEITNHDGIYTYATEYIKEEKVTQRAVNNFFGVWLGYTDFIKSDQTFDNQKVSDLAKSQKDRVYQLVKNNRPLNTLLEEESSSYLGSKFFAYKTFDAKEDSAPVIRGLNVLKNLMCYQLPTLGAATEEQINEVQNSDDFPSDGTNLEKIAFHSQNAACNSCHQYIDPAAIGLEVFDAFGKRRDTYPNGDKIEFKGTTFAGVDYSSYDEYVDILKDTFDFKHCFSKKLHSKIREVASVAKNNSCFMTQLYDGDEEPGMRTLLLNSLKTDLVRKVNKPTF